MIPSDPGFDPVQAAYNLTRKNPAIDWEIEMLGHLKTGSFDQAHRCGIKAADINLELASAPEVDARSATEHLIKAASLLEQVREFARAAEVYEQARGRDVAPGTRLIEGRRVTSPLRYFDLLVKAGRESPAREVLTSAAKQAEERYHSALKDKNFTHALDEAQFLADIHARLKDAAATATWWRHAVAAGVEAGRAIREAPDDREGDRYELSRAAFEQALTCALQLKDDKLFIDAFGAMAHTQAKAATAQAHSKEKWDAFRPMEFLMEAAVNHMVIGEFAKARELLAVAEPIVLTHWKDQRGPTLYKMFGHLAILAGKRDEGEKWRRAYHQEFERKERFDPEVVKPIQLEFDEEFFRMLGDEASYRTTLIDICRSLEAGMREVFEGVDQMLEQGLYRQAKTPLEELPPEAKDQRIWRLLSAFIEWRLKIETGAAKEGNAKAFEDHMWHVIHPFTAPRQGYLWSAILETLGAEEDPIDIYPLPRTLALIHGRTKSA